MAVFKKWRAPFLITRFGVDDRLVLMFMGAVVGVCAGLAALALNNSLMFALSYLEKLREYWWCFVLPAIGAAASSLFLDKILREGAGHGVPEVIYAVSRYGGLLRMRSSWSRLVSSFLTIGSGGSAGPEAPVVMSGAAIGSNIAKYFRLNDRQRTTLVGCGAAGAIASIFNAPIAGLVFSIEVILGEWSSINIVPIALASVSGAQISRLLQGNQVPFSHRLFNIQFIDIGASLLLAVVAALASILLARTMRFMHRTAHKVPAPPFVRAAIGGCAVGLIGIYLPVVLGEGYHPVRHMIEGAFTTGIGIAALAALMKIVATALTLGWGGSGGIFAPCLVIGSFVGITCHRVLAFLFPAVGWVNEGCFALLGMAGLISGILQAPLTAIFLIVEITGGYEVILPLILVSAVSASLNHYFEPASFYLKELVEKGQLLRPGTDARVLSDLSIQELLEKDCVEVHQNMLLREFIGIVEQSHRNYFPVVTESTRRFVGMIHLDDIRPYLFNPMMYDAVFLGQIMSRNVAVAQPDDELPDILEQMDADRLYSMPVVLNGRFMGMISKATILDHYRKELMVQTSY